MWLPCETSLQPLKPKITFPSHSQQKDRDTHFTGSQLHQSVGSRAIIKTQPPESECQPDVGLEFPYYRRTLLYGLAWGLWGGSITHPGPCGRQFELRLLLPDLEILPVCPQTMVTHDGGRPGFGLAHISLIVTCRLSCGTFTTVKLRSLLKKILVDVIVDGVSVGRVLPNVNIPSELKSWICTVPAR